MSDGRRLRLGWRSGVLAGARRRFAAACVAAGACAPSTGVAAMAGPCPIRVSPSHLRDRSHPSLTRASPSLVSDSDRRGRRLGVSAGIRASIARARPHTHTQTHTLTHARMRWPPLAAAGRHCIRQSREAAAALYNTDTSAALARAVRDGGCRVIDSPYEHGLATDSDNINNIDSTNNLLPDRA